MAEQTSERGYWLLSSSSQAQSLAFQLPNRNQSVSFTGSYGLKLCSSAGQVQN